MKAVLLAALPFLAAAIIWAGGAAAMIWSFYTAEALHLPGTAAGLLVLLAVMAATSTLIEMWPKQSS